MDMIILFVGLGITLALIKIGISIDNQTQYLKDSDKAWDEKYEDDDSGDEWKKLQK